MAACPAPCGIPLAAPGGWLGKKGNEIMDGKCGIALNSLETLTDLAWAAGEVASLLESHRLTYGSGMLNGEIPCSGPALLFTHLWHVERLINPNRLPFTDRSRSRISSIKGQAAGVGFHSFLAVHNSIIRQLLWSELIVSPHKVWARVKAGKVALVVGNYVRFCELSSPLIAALHDAARNLTRASGEFAPDCAGKTDTKTDTEKKTKKIRPMTKAARTCATQYVRLEKLGDKKPMNHVVSDYVDEKGGSVDGILRVLRDHPDEWKKADKKRTKSGQAD